MGSVGYADDVCLVAPSCHAVRKMLSVCVDFGQEYNIKFNESDSDCKTINKAIGELYMSLNLVFAVAILEIFSFVLIEQASMALHCGVNHTHILIRFIFLGENVFGVYGIYQIKRIVSS